MHRITILLISLVLIIFSCSPKKVYQQEGVYLLTPKEYAETRQAHPDHNLLDIRTPMEHKGNRIDGATNISFIGTSFKKKAIQLDTSKVLFIYCQTAHRSPYAAKKLRKLGFNTIYDLQGGFKNYKREMMADQ